MRNKLTKFLTSECPPKGMRQFAKTWKYVACMLLAFILGIGQMWAADVTLFTADFSDAAWNGATFSQGNTNNYDVINGVTFHSKDASKKFSISGGVLTWPNNNMSSNNFYLGFPVTGINDGTITITVWNGSSATRVKYVIKDNADAFSASIGSSGTATSSANPTTVTITSLSTKAFVYLGRQGSGLTTITKIVVTTPGPSCDATVPGNISKGALNAGTLTLNAAGYGSKPAKDEWYWQTAADGVDKSNSGASFNVTAAGTYYVRSLYNNDCWSDAKSFEVKATDLVANYTVIYKDGSEELKRETVEVGHTPDAYTPTKDFYTFASWSTDPSTLGSTAANTEVTLTASWTPNYTSGTYEFTGNLTMGSAPNQMTIDNNSDGKDYEAGRIDNILVSAQKIGYEATGSYGGWKLKTTNGTLRFLVENACGIRVTLGEANPLKIDYTESGVAKNASIAKSTTSEVYKVDANTTVTLTNTTSGNKTVTLKRIEILPLYTASYVDETGDGEAGGDDENVSEVTLPTPTETTIGSSTFTGWVANQTVKETKAGGVEKTAGAVLTAGETYQLFANTTFTAQWATVSNYDVKFFQGYDTNAQIGETQSISTGGHAVAPADPTRTGFAFLGWSYDGTEAHIVDVAAYGITAATNFTAMWKAVWTVTFDGAGNVIVENGETVASPNSPVMAGKVFQGWYNGENKYDFSAAVTGDLALTSKWADADANHYVYAYNDDFHFDGVVYKTPEGKVAGAMGSGDVGGDTYSLTTPYTLFSGEEGITSIIATKAIYDSKNNWVNAYLKINNSAESYLTFIIKTGYTAVLKMKMGGYSADPTITLKKGEDVVVATSGEPGGKKASIENNFNEFTYELTAGTYTLTTATKTLYISHIDLEAEAIPAKTVTYKAGEGTGSDVVDAAATEVADVPSTFTAPTGKVFNGWKDELDNDVEVGAIVSADMALTAQWINVYAVTFNMNDHGAAIDPQDVKEGAKAAKPADPSESGWDFGGWFTDNGTFEAPFDFNTPITAATPLFAKWTADPCPDKKSIVKAVMTSTSTATVTGYNDNEYAGGYIINNLADGDNAFAYDFGEGSVTGYKLKGSGSAIFATLAKGGFEAGDKVVFAVTKKAGDNKLAVYAAKDKNNVLKLAEIDVADAGIYEYKLKAADIAAIEAAGADYMSIGSYRGDYNPYIYSVELKGCRSWAIYHTLTFKNIDGTATIAAEPLEEGAYASTVAPTAPKIAMKRFIGWSESIGGSTVDLTTYTITEDKTLYAVYEDIVCPTTGTVYKFEIKDELPSENLPTSTDKDMSSYITATGDGYLTYTATADNKATINSDGTIQLKDQTAAYLKVELECALAAGDQIRAHVTNNPIRVQVGTTYDSNKDLILAKNAYEFVAITSAMEGKQVLYITRSSNGNANLADFEIYRPAKYDVSFNMMGHGSAIADLEDVVEGSKITAPSPAPTDVDYSFAGWYKENTLENEWDFDVDVVDDNITLYAKWLDKSDATLKSLKYGETEITLEAGVYTYNVSLPAFTSAVPALTAETSNPNATKVITNGTFDGEGNATSKVTVTPEVGADQIYTVNFAKGVEILLQDVTGSTTWNFANAVTETVNITGTPHVLANYGGVTNDATFESNKLEASGEKFTAGTKANLRANYIHFHTTVQGMLTISYSNTGGSNPARFIYVNGVKYDEEGSANTTAKGADRKVFVPAGDVELVMKDGEGASKNVQIYQIIFKAPDYVRTEMLGNGVYGTICVDHNVPAGGVRGVTVYEIAGREPQYGKIAFDEVTKMEAGVPYVFIAHGNEMALYYGETHVDDPINGNGMYGTFTAQTLTDLDGIYYFAKSALWSCVDLTSLNLPANRAYVKLSEIDYLSDPNPAPGRKRILLGVNGQNAATGIGNVQGDEVQSTKVLINGQLFILRGEKMYDATGRMVK